MSRRRLTDEDGIDGPFARAMDAPVRRRPRSTGVSLRERSRATQGTQTCAACGALRIEVADAAEGLLHEHYSPGGFDVCGNTAFQPEPTDLERDEAIDLSIEDEARAAEQRGYERGVRDLERAHELLRRALMALRDQGWVPELVADIQAELRAKWGK